MRKPDGVYRRYVDGVLVETETVSCSSEVVSKKLHPLVVVDDGICEP